MSFSKWIGAALGWSLGGPIGAIIGLALGSVVDSASSGQGRTTTYTRTATTRPGDFEVSLLILASFVIKADKRKDKKELDYVRQQFVAMYGKERANHAFRLFKNIVNQKNISKREVCEQIRRMMDHPSRLQLLHFLFGIAQADGHVTDNEARVIHTLAHYLGISNYDFESIKAMFYKSSTSAYRILEIEPDASVDEIKKAYRKMAKKYHPDRVIHLGEEHRKGAETKFREVQEAYEQLQKEKDF